MKKIKLSKLDEVIYEETLDNGLKVFIYKMKGFVKKYACFETRYGSINNNFVPEGSDALKRFPLGIAHFLEHKLFESNENENVFKVFEDNGAYVNAATSYEKTYYYFDTVDNFDKCLTTLIDFVQSPYFTDETVEKEKGIIGQEMDMRHDNTNLFLYEKLINNGLNNIYYKDSIIGTKNSIDKITKEDLYKCYNTFYNPSNMYLVIVGDIDEEKTLSLIKENQSKKEFKKNINIKQEEKVEPLSIRVKEKVYKRDVNTKKIGYLYKMNHKKLNDMDDFMFKRYIDIYLRILFGETSSFSKELIKDNIINSYFDYDIMFFKDLNNTFIINFFSDVIDKDALDKRLSDKLNEKTDMKYFFNLFKKNYLAQYIKGFSNVFDAAGFIRSSYHNYGKILDNLYDYYEKLNYEDFIKTINKLDFSNYCTVIIDKKEGENNA